MDQPSTLDARYGRTPGARKRTQWVAIGSAIGFAMVFTAWLVWGGLGGAAARFQARDVGYVIQSDRAVQVRWRFTVDPGTPARCAVQALNSSFGIVGWKVVDLPASEFITRELTETVLTTERPVTGLIYRCWLT